MERHPLAPRSLPPDLDLNTRAAVLARQFCSETLESCEDDDRRCLVFAERCNDVWDRYSRWCREGAARDVAMPLVLVAVAKQAHPSLKIRRRADGAWCWCNVRRRIQPVCV